MISLSILVTLAAVLTRPTKAASCWRDTDCTGPTEQAFPGAWDANNFSPASRTASPVTILSAQGNFVSNYPITTVLQGNESLFIYDFGKEVGGIVTINYSATGAGSFGLAFTEAKNFTGQYSDDSDGIFSSSGHSDGAMSVSIAAATQEANFTMPDPTMRGGFRYLSLFGTSDAQVTIQDITLELSFAPAWSNLRAYQGYFDSSDPLLNKIWYASAYTLQTNSIPSGTGRRFPISPGWENDVQLDLGTTDPTIYVDGSKRDRTVWAGDLGIAVPSVLRGTGDLDGVRNTLQVLINDQASTGELPFAGPGLNIYGSDTYHMATLIGIYEYYLFTKDDAFMSANWNSYKAAVSFITAKIDSTGLLDVTGTNDWGRLNQGGHNTEANMLMYRILTTASSIATWMDDSALSSNLLTMAATLKAVVNVNCWDAAAGAFGDSEGDNSIHPQDGNSMALFFGAANDSSIQSISSALTQNWISIGAVAPELPDNLIGFGQSFEIKGHLAARQATRALDLIRRAWGWYVNNPYGTESTILEGYLADGSFGYRATTGYGGDYSYTSHAHGWSTGPTDALTSYIVGLQLTGPGGTNWTLAPQFGDLTHAEGGFTTPLGTFTASWTTDSGGYSISWSYPSGTTGTLMLPTQSNQTPDIQGNGAQRMMAVGVLNKADGTFVIEGQESTGSLRVVY